MMQLHFKRYGQGKPLLILHGLYGSSDNWHSAARELGSRYEVFVPDLRNHGKSGHSPRHSYEDLQQDILEFLDEHIPEHPIILGHSMGGKAAMLFALMHPERIRKLIVVDIAPKTYKSLLDFNPEVVYHMNILNAFASVDISQMKSRSEIDESFSQYIKDAGLRQFLLKNADRDGEGRFFWTLNFKSLQENFPKIMDWPELKNYSVSEVPALFIRGEKSNYIKEDDEKRISELFPENEIVTIFDAGHWVAAEQPVRFLNAVKNWIEK